MIKSDENYLASDTVGGQIDYWEPRVVISQAGAQEEHRRSVPQNLANITGIKILSKSSFTPVPTHSRNPG